MIYLDVSSAAASAMNTGVQRIIRNLYRHLHQHIHVEPVVWQSTRQVYASLSSRQKRLLTDPFQDYEEASSHPERLGRPHFFQKWYERLCSRVQTFDTLQGKAVLLVPDIFTDSRIDYLKNKTSFTKVAIFYDALTWTNPEWATPKRLKRFEDYLEALSQFDLIFSISRQSALDLQTFWQKHAMLAPEIQVEWLPCDFEKERPAAITGGIEKPLQVLCVSSLEPRKNHQRLLEACESLWASGCEFKLTLIGREVKGVGSSPVSFIRELQKRNRPVEWLMHVNDQKLKHAYETSALTIYPSMAEGFGVPILESLWYHKPCLCSHHQAMGEVVQGGGCYPIDPYHVASIASGLFEVLTKPDLLQKLSQEASERSFLTWDRYTQQILQRMSPFTKASL